MDDDDSIEMGFCPSCGREVYEFTEKCPHCGDWITPTYRSPQKRRRWQILVLAVILLLLFALLRGLIW